MNPRQQEQSTITDLRTRRSYHPDYGALARNRISMARADTGLSPAEFAAMLGPLVGRQVNAGHVTSWETRVTPPGDVLMAAMAVSPSATSSFGVRSHKFIAAYIGCDAAQRISSRSDAEPDPNSGSVRLSARTVRSRPDDDPCQMYVWPFGSVIFHLVEDLEFPDIASLALWRSRSYEEELAWAGEALNSATGGSCRTSSYVLSAYWVHTPIWAGQILESALQIICAPSVLLDRDDRNDAVRDGSAHRAERELLAEGYSPAGIRPFGVGGVATGYASWSGVVYHPFDEDRALTEQDLVSLELALQSVWVYSEYINSRVELGADPATGSSYGCSFLRASRSRLLNPRPQETGQYRSMRDAIVETSGVQSHLDLAIDALGEIRGRS